MTELPLKYAQVGTRAVGNRLLEPGERALQSDPRRANTLTSGHRACRGCGEALAARSVVDAALAAAGGQAVAANATGCLEVFSTPYPESAWQLPWVHSLFANAPSVAAGMAAGLGALGRRDVRVLAQGGDGAMVDIGFAALSGAFERGDDVLHVCYDNGGYMNTGVQRSGATPPAAATTTTPAVGGHPGASMSQGKSAPLVAMAHEIPYVATATVADLHDLEAKVRRAMAVRGARYLHVLSTCPLGWGSDASRSIELARLAVETGIFPVFEARDGELTAVQRIRRRRPVEEYLRPQGRFAHLFEPEPQHDVLAALQARADRTIARFGLLDADG